MKLWDARLQVYEENSFTHPFMYFSFIFSECIPITSSEESLKVREGNFLQQKVVLLVIYLFIHDSSKSTIFMLNIAFDVLLSAVFVKYNKLESFVSFNINTVACICQIFHFYYDILLGRLISHWDVLFHIRTSYFILGRPT